MLNREEYKSTFHHDLTQEEFDKIVPITLDNSNAKTIESLSLVDKETKEVVEFVRVVRCKDCKYCYSEGFVNVRNVCEKHYDFGNVDDDWYCADGEREDGDRK